jgi:NADH-quinone oxidoreductase subunit C
MNEILDKIKQKYNAEDVTVQRERLAFVTVAKDVAIDVVTWLRDYEGFSHFVVMSCVDWIEDGKFQLLYLLHNPETKIDLGVKTYIDRENPVMESAHHLWKQLWTYQRELREAFGIDFPEALVLKRTLFLKDGKTYLTCAVSSTQKNIRRTLTSRVREGRHMIPLLTCRRNFIRTNR